MGRTKNLERRNQEDSSSGDHETKYKIAEDIFQSELNQKISALSVKMGLIIINDLILSYRCIHVCAMLKMHMLLDAFAFEPDVVFRALYRKMEPLLCSVPVLQTK